jgi:hypothetical protein
LGWSTIPVGRRRIKASKLCSAQRRLLLAIVSVVGGLTVGCSTLNGWELQRSSDVSREFSTTTTIRAQSGDPADGPGASELAVGASSTAATTSAYDSPESLGGTLPTGSVVAPAPMPPVPRTVAGPLGTAIESLFGEASTSNWTPLYFSELFAAGWDEPFVFSPPSDSGALRQEWLNAANGVFYRQWTLNYNYRCNILPSGNADFGTWGIFAPLSRRLELFITVPFVGYRRGTDPTPFGGSGTSIPRPGAAGSASSYKETFGDVTVTPQVMLQETKNTSIMSILTIRTPTGSKAADNGATSLGPQIQFWQGLPNRWVIRGGVGPTIPLTATGLRTTLDTNLSVGKFLTLDDVRYFKEFTVWLAVNNSATTDNRGPAADSVTVLPGIRFLVTKNTWFLYGVEISLIAPKNEDFGMYFTLVRRW